MGKIIERIRERDIAAFDRFFRQEQIKTLEARLRTKLYAEQSMVLPDQEGASSQVAQLTKRVHSLEFQVLRLTPGTREWAEARKEQFESQQRAEVHKALARRAERRAFWAAIARLMGLRRG